MLVEMFTQEEIADRLGCTTRTIRRRLHKIRESICDAA
jgi:DNA-directed RNA polymerase specialized sigma24 family protein